MGSIFPAADNDAAAAAGAAAAAVVVAAAAAAAAAVSGHDAGNGSAIQSQPNRKAPREIATVGTLINVKSTYTGQHSAHKDGSSTKGLHVVVSSRSCTHKKMPSDEFTLYSVDAILDACNTAYPGAQDPIVPWAACNDEAVAAVVIKTKPHTKYLDFTKLYVRHCFCSRIR